MKNKITVKLVGEDGNIFNLMVITRKALVENGQEEEASRMVKEITGNAKSYDEALQIIMEYVNVE